MIYAILQCDVDYFVQFNGTDTAKATSVKIPVHTGRLVHLLQPHQNWGHAF